MGNLKKLKPRETGYYKETNKAMYDLRIKGYSYLDIAECYGLPQGTVRKRISEHRMLIKYEKNKSGKIYEFIDLGKLQALLEAGWNIKMVAAEFRKDIETMNKIVDEWMKDYRIILNIRR